MRGLTKRAWRKNGKLVTTSTPGRVHSGIMYSKKPAKPNIDTGGVLGVKIPTGQTMLTVSTGGPPTGADVADVVVNNKPRKQKPPTTTPVSEKQLIEYTSVLQDLISCLVTKQLDKLWNEASFAKMDKKVPTVTAPVITPVTTTGEPTKNAGAVNTTTTTGTATADTAVGGLVSDPDKEKEKEVSKNVAAFAAKAVEDLFGLETLGGVHTPSRVARMAAGVTGQQIRLALHRKNIVEGLILNTQGVLAYRNVPGTHVEKRNTGRQLNKFVKKTGRLPGTFFELEPTPPRNITPTIPLSMVDDVYTFWQLPTQTTSPTNNTNNNNDRTRLILSVCLPTVKRPVKSAHWSWVDLTVGVDDKVVAQYLSGEVLLCLPTLQVSRGKLKAHITVDRLAPEKVLNPQVAMGFDWGGNKLLTGALIWQDTTGNVYISGPGHMFVFQARKYLAKDYRRQLQAQHIRAKIVDLEKNVQTTTSLTEKARLNKKVADYTTEALNIDVKRRNANKELARLAACWVVSQALAYGAGMVVVENLDAMEPAFNKKQRNRLSQLIRGRLRDALKTACSDAGIIFQEVNPDYTSKICFNCGAWLKFKTTPGGTSGRAWAVCGTCGLSCDRDYCAAVNIGARELRNPGTGQTRKYAGHEKNSYANDLGNVKIKRLRAGKNVPLKRTSKKHKIRQTKIKKSKNSTVVTTTSTLSANPNTTAPPATSVMVTPPASSNNTTTSSETVTIKSLSKNNKTKSKDKVKSKSVKPALKYNNPLRRKSRRSNCVCTGPRPGVRASEIPVVHRWVRRTSSGAKPSSIAKPSEPSVSPIAPNVKPPPASLETVSVLVRVLDGMRYAHRHSINCTPVRLPYDGFELVDKPDISPGLSNKP